MKTQLLLIPALMLGAAFATPLAGAIGLAKRQATVRYTYILHPLVLRV